MRKYILFLLFLCSLSAARGQTEGKYEYWFDDDRSTVQTGTSPANSWQLEADVSGLSESIHALHIQVEGNTMHSIPITRYFVKTPVNAALTGRYWFDDEVDKTYTPTQTQGVFDIDVSPLSEGFHSIHYQIVGTDGNISQTATRSFYKVYMPAQSSWRCWFDNDYSTVQAGTDMSQTLVLDVTQLSDGYHVLHIQVDGGAQSQSTPITKHFVKIPQTIGVDHFTCLCMVDDKLHHIENVSASNGFVEWNFDVSALPQGFHRLFVQIVTPSGAASNTYDSFFLRETTRAEFAQMKCVYAIDGAEFYTEAGTLADGTYHFDLDVASLDDGLHRIAYMLSNGLGVTTKTQCQFFVKTPVGGNGITEYWYWLNDEADSNAQKVTLAERQDPFSLIKLLPVAHKPIRSSFFEFRVENGNPVVYAKNDFHIRFYDAAGRFTDATKQYVDEQVGQAVTDLTLLTPGVRATTDRPAENAIKWYKLTAEAGDSLSFRLDRAATVQLFSPTGKEVFAASGAKAVEWGGTHAEENGTYYLALHDVTATYGSTVSIDYQHIDRYAVLRQDILAVGNGGPSTVSFWGNGFDELLSVDLVKGDVTIPSAEISTEGKATVSVKWDFNEATIGQYKAVFHFAEGEVTVEKGIIVENAVPISISSTESHAAQFLVSTGNTYNYKVKNHGNMTAYDVPMTLTVYASSEQLLSWVMADGTELADYEVIETPKEGYVYGRRYMLTRTLRPSTTEALAVKVKTNTTGHIYVDLDGVGGPSEAVTSIDPNDIYGYQDEYGSKVIRGGLTDVYYTIEFENDPEFATASAHDIYVSDQLDSSLFDLSTFSPTRIQIGDQEVTLTDENRAAQVVTIDLRPRIYAIAQVAWSFNATTGFAEWHISSLDPMTNEPTTEAMDGVLPVNNGGNGIGQLSFDISLKPNLPIDTEIPNSATIVFDTNEPIVTPTWVNTIGELIMMGDTNGDGEINTVDASYILMFLVGRTPADFVEGAADVDGSGEIDTLDATAILKKLVE